MDDRTFDVCPNYNRRICICEKPFAPQSILIDLASMVQFDDRPEWEEWCAAMACTLEQIMRDSFYIDPVCVLWPGELMQLPPWMPQVGGIFPDGRVTWFEWIQSVQVIP